MVVLALVGLAGLSVATVRRPFPQVDGEISLPGLTTPAPSTGSFLARWQVDSSSGWWGLFLPGLSGIRAHVAASCVACYLI